MLVTVTRPKDRTRWSHPVVLQCSGFEPSSSTSQLADDAITLLDYVGWNNGRELHLVGVSLGGMVSQGEFSSLEIVPY